MSFRYALILSARLLLSVTQGVLRDYAQLIEDYKTLKRSVEGQGNGVSIGQSEVIEKARSSHVLVLVDGNGYVVGML
jgi:hypothetical protein